VASITVSLDPADRFTPIQRRLVDDLPAHVKNSAQWLTQPGRAPGYYATSESNKLEPVEFINNEWYLLAYSRNTFGTRTGLILERGHWNLGYWHLTDPNTPITLTPHAPPHAPDIVTTLADSHQIHQDPAPHLPTPQLASRVFTTQAHRQFQTQPRPSTQSPPPLVPQPHQTSPSAPPASSTSPCP
jgi:hypothetical protein